MSTATLPTLDQRMASLNRANEIRTARAELKVEMKAGVRTLAEVLRADEDFIQTMKLADLLRSVPAMGKVKAQRAMNACQISPTAPVRNIPPARREQLLAWLSVHHKRIQIGPHIEQEAFPASNGGYR